MSAKRAPLSEFRDERKKSAKITFQKDTGENYILHIILKENVVSHTIILIMVLYIAFDNSKLQKVKRCCTFLMSAKRAQSIFVSAK